MNYLCVIQAEIPGEITRSPVLVRPEFKPLGGPLNGTSFLANSGMHTPLTFSLFPSSCDLSGRTFKPIVWKFIQNEMMKKSFK